ncbi:MAG: ImmA/IrrE family metallo-endopeptidase [Sulfobacillus sp.]
MMRSFLDEEVPPVNPLSVAAIEELGRCFLDQLAPEMLVKPQPLDVLGLADTRLQKFGIHVYPASREEIGNRDGATNPKGDGEVSILVAEEVWETLESAIPKCYYARSTVCHEIGHAILHVPVLRRRLLLNDALARTQRVRLRAYEDPEWQAWTFAGAILIPSATLRMLQAQQGPLTPELVSSTFEVSAGMAQSHLARLKWPNYVRG